MDLLAAIRRDDLPFNLTAFLDPVSQQNRPRNMAVLSVCVYPVVR